MKKFVCPVCGYVHEGDNPPKSAPSAAFQAQCLRKLKSHQDLGQQSTL